MPTTERTTSLLIGLDVGTSAAKAIAIDQTGRVVAEAEAPTGFSVPRPGWAQQDPRVWRDASFAALRSLTARVDPETIVGVGLTGQMHGLVLVDADGEPTTDALMWNDQRSADACARLERALGADAVLAATGNRLLPGFTAPKIAWLREHDPDALARATTLMLPKDFVRLALTGVRATDVADASGTLLLDVGRRTWSRTMLDALVLDESMLPALHESTDATGTITRDAAHATGLPVGIPVAAGAGDQAASAIGTGVLDDGAVTASLGTSGVVFAASRRHRPSAHGELHAFCHAVPDRWHVMGVMLSAAGSLDWFARTITPDWLGDGGFDAITEHAARIAPGCEGLAFLPYLTGERCPHPDPDARGAFIGLSLRHGRAHMARAVLEGITFGMAELLALVRTGGATIDRVRLTGGGAASAFWRQLCADAFDACIATPGDGETTAGAAEGAARLAGVTAGIWPDVDAACAASLVTEGNDGLETTPGPDAPAVRTAFARYRALYPALAPWFAGDVD